MRSACPYTSCAHGALEKNSKAKKISPDMNKRNSINCINSINCTLAEIQGRPVKNKCIVATNAAATKKNPTA
jgi:hypothetical protein